MMEGDDFLIAGIKKEKAEEPPEESVDDKINIDELNKVQEVSFKQ